MINKIKRFFWRMFHRHFTACHRVYLSDGWHDLRD